MAKLFSSMHLSIRKKVVLGFIFSIIVFVVVGIIAYHNLLTIERKFNFVVRGHELHDTLLEARRYEKNFLLYGQRKDFEEALTHLERGKEVYLRLHPDVRGLKGVTYLEKLESEMDGYGQLLRELVAGEAGRNPSPRTRQQIEAEIRNVGKDLVDLSLRLSDFEHTRVQQIVKSLETKIIFFASILLVLGYFLTVLVTRKIVRPLTVIERTTQRIARGDFKPLPVVQTRDETQSVVEAFNKMITELEKQQDQLVQAQKLSSLGVLTSGIAHQLNNPLNNISTSCQILQEEIADGNSELTGRLLNNIDQEVDRARDIVKGLLEFSREREFQRNWVNLENLVIKTTRLISSQLPAGVEIFTEIPQDLDIYVDAQKLQEVLLNLLLNASQAMPNEVGRISVAAAQDEKAKQVEILVKDTGCGIPEENLPHVFDPFFSTKEVGYGTGLGLSVAHGFIKQHNGTLSVASKVDEGSVFTIRLPLRDQEVLGD
ncbi:MAG: HAMP domain-containing protein [Deltaproteobacteria bacterium]|nr:MAG: HAMP domain-containing protein [Deltaproteobacteria bacterium]